MRSAERSALLYIDEKLQRGANRFLTRCTQCARLRCAAAKTPRRLEDRESISCCKGHRKSSYTYTLHRRNLSALALRSQQLRVIAHSRGCTHIYISFSISAASRVFRQSARRARTPAITNRLLDHTHTPYYTSVQMSFSRAERIIFRICDAWYYIELRM